MAIVQKEVISFQQKVSNWVDNTGFAKLFLIWIGIILLMGIVYYATSSPMGSIVHAQSKNVVTGFFEHIYFSFITATSTGFGDIVPTGFFQVLSVLEVIFGLVFLAIITSKIVSIKQDAILQEIYDLSVNNQLNLIKSSLTFFRMNLHKLSDNEKNFTPKRIKDVTTQFHTFVEVLDQTKRLLNQLKKSKRVLDPLLYEVLILSIDKSLNRLNSFLDKCTKIKTLPNEMPLNEIQNCINYTKQIVKLTPTKYDETNAIQEQITQLEKHLAHFL